MTKAFPVKLLVFRSESSKYQFFNYQFEEWSLNNSIWSSKWKKEKKKKKKTHFYFIYFCVLTVFFCLHLPVYQAMRPKYRYQSQTSIFQFQKKIMFQNSNLETYRREMSGLSDMLFGKPKTVKVKFFKFCKDWNKKKIVENIYWHFLKK